MLSKRDDQRRANDIARVAQQVDALAIDLVVICLQYQQILELLEHNPVVAPTRRSHDHDRACSTPIATFVDSDCVKTTSIDEEDCDYDRPSIFDEEDGGYNGPLIFDEKDDGYDGPQIFDESAGLVHCQKIEIEDDVHHDIFDSSNSIVDKKLLVSFTIDDEYHSILVNEFTCIVTIWLHEFKDVHARLRTFLGGDEIHEDSRVNFFQEEENDGDIEDIF